MSAPGATTFFRITLHRSAIGLPERTQGALAALGLRRRGRTVFQPVNASVAGLLFQVKELVRVAEVDRALSPAELRAERRPHPGFYLESAVPRMAGARREEAGDGSLEEKKVE